MRAVDANYNRQFIQIDFALLEDPGFLQFVTRAEFATYLILRRYVWRGGHHRLGLDEMYHRDHKLVSAIGVRTIANLLGLKERTRVSKHLTALEKEGVIKRHRTGRETIYILGEWFQPEGWTVSREYFYLENVFGLLKDGRTSDVSKNDTSDVPSATHQTWRKTTHSNIEENREINTVNGSPILNLPDLDQPAEKTEFILQEILAAMGDKHSEQFYRLVAAKVPESVICEALSEINHDGAESPPKVFTHRMNLYATDRLKRGIG